MLVLGVSVGWVGCLVGLGVGVVNCFVVDTVVSPSVPGCFYADIP